MPKFIIVADDLTGCGDIAYWGINFNLNQKILFIQDLKNYDLSSEKNLDVLIIDTESRLDDKKTSQKKIRLIVNWLMIQKTFSLDNFLIFKKIDSTLRGNWIEESDVLIENFKLKKIPLIPAFPEYKRTTKNSFHYVDSKLLHESEFAKNSGNLITTSHIPTLLDNKSKFPQNYKIFDVISQNDFDEILPKICYNYAVFVGSSKFYNEILQKVLQDKKQNHNKVTKQAKKTFPNLFDEVFIISGSLNTATLTQLNLLKQQIDFETIESNNDFLISKEQKIVIAESNKFFNENYKIQKLLTKSRQILENGTSKKQKILTILSGGDTAHKFLEFLDIKNIEILEKIAIGIILCKDKFRDFYFALKPGGFGEQDFFVKTIEKYLKK